MLDILFEDEDLVAINKPNGLLVHRTKIARDADEFAMQMLRDQIDIHVYPCHRLDRKTSGVLLFAKSEEVNCKMQEAFMNQQVSKKYWAIVRGFTEDSGKIDYDLKRDDGKIQSAITHYKTIAKIEIDLPFGKHSTSRYSLVEVTPETGRMHQIRKHFAHIFHPIIGDRPHGCNKQNKLFLEKFGLTEMMLHAKEISFQHPLKDEKVVITAPLRSSFKKTLADLKISI